MCVATEPQHGRSGRLAVVATAVVLLVAVALAPARASAQVCGYLALEAARKREALRKAVRPPPPPPVRRSRHPLEDLREEQRQAVRAFEREVWEYQRDVATIVERAYKKRRIAVERNYGKRISEIEAEERQWREKAIVQLRAFIAKYPDDADYTPIRMAQLGELYYERAAEEYNRKQEAFTRRLEALAGKEGAGPEPEPPKQRFERTVATYRHLVRRFPAYRDADKIYYILGYALSAQGDEKEAAEVFETLVRRFPRSRRIAEVWTRLGEYYFDQRPRQLRKAIHAYQQAMRVRKSVFFDKALYKLAWSYYLDNQFGLGVRRFQQLVEFSDAQRAISGRAGSDLRAEAIQYMALSFTEEGWGGVRQAARWFAGNRQPYVREVLARLADLLFDSTRYPEAIRAYELALQRYPTAPESPRMLGCQVVSYRLMRDFPNEARAAERIATTFGPGTRWYELNRGNPKALKQVDLLAQGSVLAAATFHHKQANAFARSGKLGKARAEYSQAATLYRRFLDRFPTSPDAYELTYYLAETLYYAFRFEEAAAVYERVRDDREEKRHQIAAALGAFKSLQNWIEARRFARPPLPRLTKDGRKILGGPGPDPMPSYVLRLINAGNRFLKLAPRHTQAPSVSYLVAELYYRYKVLKEARARFAAIIDNWPGHPATLNAARLLVDSYRLTQDWTNVEKWSRRLMAAQIASGSERRALQRELGKLKTGAAFRRAEALQKGGRYEAAAKEYIRLARENPKAEFADIALYNAGANYEQLRKYESANRAYQRLLRRYPRSLRADKALFRMAVNAENFFEFDRAVRLYLRLYREYPKSQKRGWALYNAALSLQNQQRYRQAARYYLDYARQFSERQDAAPTFFRAGTLYLKDKRYSEARRIFTQFIDRFGGNPRYRGLAIAAQARIADSWAKQRRRSQALRARRKVVEAFDRSGFGPGSPAAVEAARARFLEVEAEFARFQGRKITGSARRQAKVLVELIKEMRRLEADYRSLKRFKVLDWYLAALFRVGQLYRLLSKKMLDAPMPKELKSQLERDTYRTQLEDRAGVLERKATRLFVAAYEEGKKQGVRNRWTHRALEELSVLNPLKYRVPKEPRTALQIETVSPNPIVRALPGVGGKVGAGWKPAGK